MWFDRLLQGFIDTFLMVGVSSLIALLVGIPMAVILVTSDKGGSIRRRCSTGRWARS